MIRATLDTNVLAPGIITSPHTVHGQVLQAWRDNKYSLVLSEVILTKLSRTLSQPYFSARLTAAQIEATLNLFRSEASIVPQLVTIAGVAPHPEDDLILATALSGGLTIWSPAMKNCKRKCRSTKGCLSSRHLSFCNASEKT